MNRKGLTKKAGASPFSLTDHGAPSAADETAVILKLYRRAIRLHSQSKRQLKIIDETIYSHRLSDMEKHAMIDESQRKFSVCGKEIGKILAIVTRAN